MAEVGVRMLKSIESGKANPTIVSINKLAIVLGMEMKMTIKQAEL